MRILFSVHLYPPTHNCGGEYFIHNLSKYLISQGNEVRVLLHQAYTYGISEIYEFEGVTVFPPARGVNENLVMWADVMLSHLEFTNWTVQMGRIYSKPTVFISHNTHFDAYQFLADNGQTAVIYNSHAMRSMSPFNNKSIVLHPSVDFRKYNVNPEPENSEFITMINCNENKGGKILSRLAKAMPERKFLAVKGSYDEQFVPNLPNVVIRENGPDILPVYKMTRILLMPSRYESWGMTATEAMSNGIPVICTPTFGLKENCGEAGIYIPERGEIDEQAGIDDGDSYNIKPIIKAIKSLDNKKTYQKASEKSRARAIELDPKKELEETLNFLVSLCN